MSPKQLIEAGLGPADLVAVLLDAKFSGTPLGKLPLKRLLHRPSGTREYMRSGRQNLARDKEDIERYRRRLTGTEPKSLCL